jgi:hydrogenase expression/formation protein HypD
MKYLDEFNDPTLARGLLAEIGRVTTRPWTLMELCGGQTHSIIRHGIDQLLPKGIELLHGPGCPVCVTPLVTIDRALAIAALAEVTFCSFGDMLRVPGSTGDLFTVRSKGADVRVVHSPLDAVRIAVAEPHRQVVFFAIGFETTAPANALAVRQAQQLGLANFSLLVSHVLVPPAVEAILAAPACRVQAILAAGHVCTVMGWREYQPLATRHHTPMVITGFEPVDLLDGIRRAIVQLERGVAEVENAYPRAVAEEGNPVARALLAEVFETCDREWRGIGTIPASGWRLRAHLRGFDAEGRFADDIGPITATEPPECRAGEVLRGIITPAECEMFGTVCTPRTPLGATMVSGEGTCAAYYAHRRVEVHHG